ncbi:putative mitochondrial protein [Vitis vinifera]|uniref:Putative mitochondrial protein n=1 Tax=Vitis vinifera TaxID=29760 RepID=A0A438IAZ4_VITVI|nr:putative mitochondrial protein [Vitis vinifera]
MKGGQCWIGVEFKSFTISVEVVNERVDGRVLERDWFLYLDQVWVEESFPFAGGCGGVLLWERGEVFSECLEGGGQVVEDGTSGFLGGWTTFTNKLQSLGVTPPSSGSNPCPKGFVGDGTMVAPSNGKSFAEILRKPNIEVSNAVWLELGEEEIGNKIKVVELGGDLLLFDIESAAEAEMVLQGFMAVDEDTTEQQNFWWASEVVKTNGRKMPGSVQVVVGCWKISIQLRWDVPPWVQPVVLVVGAESRRPISLVGSLYKWLAKVLANKLKKVVGKVVSKAQGAFVEGRQILDAVLIANEAIDSVLKNNENGIMCKLNIEKAYDNVDCFSMMVNGTPEGFFQNSRGLRQGDPLSPYLFVIAMEVFSSFLKRVVEGGFMSGYKVKDRNEEGVQISHLLFADDTLVFCQATQDQLTYLSWLLMWFEAVSGLRINLEKSELIPVGKVENIDDLAFLWVLRLSQYQCGMEWKSVSVKD